MEWVEENNSNWIDVEVSDDQLMFIWDDERLWNYRNNMQECWQEYRGEMLSQTGCWSVDLFFLAILPLLVIETGRADS